MPRLLEPIPAKLKQTLLNLSFERLVIVWLMQDGWQVFNPEVDHSHKTDVLISDGKRYFRLQIKTVDGAKGKAQLVRNQWQGSGIDFVIYFARNGEWGYIASAFSEEEKPLNAPEHLFFLFKKNDFLKAFHLVDIEKKEGK